MISVHSAELERYPNRFLILAIDFDGQYPARFNDVTQQIPSAVRKRVFILGAAKEPQDLKRELNATLERIGEKLAQDCRESERTTWQHPELVHNIPQVEKTTDIRSIFFS